MADQIYKIRDPQGNIREIRGPEGASDEEVIAQAQKLFAAPAQSQIHKPSDVSGIPGPRQEAGALARFGRGLASLADVTVGGVLPAVVQQVGYPVARALQMSPQEATQAIGGITRAVEQPFGKAFGVTQTPEYQQEASRQLMDFIGANINKGAKWISQQTGLPEADVSNMIGTATIAAPNVLAAAKPTLNALAPVTKPVVEAAQAVRKTVVSGAKDVASGGIGAISGKPGEAYRQAYEAGRVGDRTFLENLRGKASPDELLGEIKQGIAKIQADTSQAYSTAKTGWAADTTPLNIDNVTAAYDKVKASMQQRNKPLIGEAEQKIVNEIGDVLDQWKNDPTARTALDFDALKRRIDAIYPESPKHSNAQRAVTEVRNAVKNEITSNVQGYADAMKAYDTQMDLLRDINKALGTGDKVAKETAINKALGLLKNKPASEFKRNLVEQLQQQGDVNIFPAVAGQELGQWLPTSGVGRAVAGGGLTAAFALRHPEMAVVLPFTSPRLMGETAYGVGRLGGAVGQGRGAVMNALSTITPEQAAFANMLAQQAAARQQSGQ